MMDPLLLTGAVAAVLLPTLTALLWFAQKRLAKLEALRNGLAAELGLVRKKTRREDAMSGTMGERVPVDVRWDSAVISTGEVTIVTTNTRYCVSTEERVTLQCSTSTIFRSLRRSNPDPVL